MSAALRDHLNPMAGIRSTPNPSQTPSLNKSTSSSKQTSIAGFFQKKSSVTSPGEIQSPRAPALPVRTSPRKTAGRSTHGSDQSLTPAPSSDAPELSVDESPVPAATNGFARPNGLPSPITPANHLNIPSSKDPSGYYSPSRKVGVHRANHKDPV